MISNLLRKAFVASAFMGCLVARSQTIGTPYHNSTQAINEAIELHDDGKYEQAILKYLSINSNDSFYMRAQYELALSYNEVKKYEKAIEVCRRALRQNSVYRQDFMLLLASAYAYSGKIDSAIAVFEKGQKEYPYTHRFHFEKGVTYNRAKKFAEGLKQMELSLRTNALHPGSHRQIGEIAIRSGRPALALLALNFYCILNNSGDEFVKVLTMMSEISEGNYVVQDTSAIDPAVLSFADEWNELDEIVRSKTALSVKYKKALDLDDQIFKQLQVLCDKMPTSLESNNWLMKFYFDFYNDVWKSKRFEGMCLYMVQNLSSKEISKEVKQNKPKVDEFAKWAGDLLNKMRREKDIVINGKEEKVNFWYDNGEFYAIGFKDDTEKTYGKWTYFHPNAEKSAEGSFEKGKRTGEWKYYHSDGVLSGVRNYKEDKLEGVLLEYYENGAISEKLNYTNDELDGEAFTYYPNEAKKGDYFFTKGKMDGHRVTYKSNGYKDAEFEMVKGVMTGPYITFYTSGKKYFEGHVINSNYEGKATFFHEDGTVSAEGSYLTDKYNGEWKYYHNNGKLKETGKYKSGTRQGNWKEYNEEGKLTSDENYENGSFKGVCKYYDDKGRLLSEYVYNAKGMDSYKFFDTLGNVIHHERTSGGKLNFVRYNKFRGKVGEGQMQDGKETGTWKQYYYNGALRGEAIYDKGVKSGIEKLFYNGGMLQSEIYYESGNMEGYARYYFKNGKIQSEGYYKNDQKQGSWTYYHSNGQILSKEYFYNGDINGTDEQFYFDGKKSTEDTYILDIFFNRAEFDSTGKMYNKTNLKFGSGKYVLKHLNGKAALELNYRYGSPDGEGKTYFGNGKLRETYSYQYSKLNGMDMEYHDNGKLFNTGMYKNGEEDSIWMFYNSEGKISSKRNYKNGERHGAYQTFWSNGSKQLVRNFKDGYMDGEQYLYAPDGSLMLRTLYREGDLMAYTYMDKNNNFVPWIYLQGESGTVKAFFANGNTSVEFTLNRGEFHGSYKTWYANGKPMEDFNYKYDNREGVSKTFYDDGTLKEDEQYFYDALNGWSREYHANGKLKSETPYMNGKAHGISTKYDPTGKQISRVRYIYGNIYE